MKTAIKLFTVAILAAVLTSCHQDEPDTPDYYWPWDGLPWTKENTENPEYWISDYGLNILFINEDGDNLFEGIKKSFFGGSVSDEEYNLITISEFTSDEYCDVSYKLMDDGQIYFTFPFTSPYLQSGKMVTRKFTCPHIFGDDREHTIITKYVELPKIPYCLFPHECVSFTLDGNEYEVRDGNRITVVIPRSAD